MNPIDKKRVFYKGLLYIRLDIDGTNLKAYVDEYFLLSRNLAA